MEARRCQELIRQARSSRLNYVYTALVEIRKQYIKTAKGVEMLTGAGLVQRLIELLQTRHSLEEQCRSKVTDLCMSILGNMCMEDVTRKMVLKLKAVSTLVDVLEEAETEMLQNRSCRCLANLLLSPGSWELVHSSEVIERITKLLQDTENDECRQTYIRAVRLLGQTGHHVRVLVNKGSVSVVLKHIDCDTEAINKYALRCIHSLCTHGNTPNLASQVVSSGKLGYLLTLTKKYNEQAFHVIVKLCDHQNFRPDFGNVGGISAFVELFRSKDECCEAMWPDIISALCLCAKEAVNRVKLREEGALIIFLEILLSKKFSGLHSRVISALVCFLYDQASFGILLENKMVPVLIEHLGDCFGNKLRCVEEVDEQLKETVAKRDALVKKERESKTEVKKDCENSKSKALKWKNECSKDSLDGETVKGNVQRDVEEEKKACDINNDENAIQEPCRNPGTENTQVADNKQEENSNTGILSMQRNPNVPKVEASSDDKCDALVEDVEMCDIVPKCDGNMDDMKGRSVNAASDEGRCAKVIGDEGAGTDDQSDDTADEDIDPIETSTPARPIYSIDSPTYESAMDTTDTSYSEGAKCIEKFTPPHRVDWSDVGYSTPPPPVNWAAGKVYSPLSNLSYYSPSAGSPGSSPECSPGQGTSPGLQTGSTVGTCPSGYSPGHSNKLMDTRSRHKYTGINSKLYNMSRSPASSPERGTGVDRLGANGCEGDKQITSLGGGRLCGRRRTSRTRSSDSDGSYNSDSSFSQGIGQYEYSPVSSPPAIDQIDPIVPINPQSASAKISIDNQTMFVQSLNTPPNSEIQKVIAQRKFSSPKSSIEPTLIKEGKSSNLEVKGKDLTMDKVEQGQNTGDGTLCDIVEMEPAHDNCPGESPQMSVNNRSSNSSFVSSQHKNAHHDTTNQKVKLKQYQIETTAGCSMQNSIITGKGESAFKEVENRNSLLETDTVKVKSRSVILENNILILLSAVSQMPDPSLHLVTKEVLTCILGYIGRMEAPLARAARLLSRVLRNPLCFDKLLSLHAPIVIYSQLLQYADLDELLSVRPDRSVAGRRGARGQSLDDSSDSDRFSMTDDSMAEEDFKSTKTEGGFTSPTGKQKHSYKGVYHKQEEEVCGAGKCGIAFLSDLTSVADTLYGRGVVTRLLILAQPYQWLSICLSVPYIIRASESRQFYFSQLALLENLLGLLLEQPACCSFTVLTSIRGINFLMKNICSKGKYSSPRTSRAARHKRAISRSSTGAAHENVCDKSTPQRCSDTGARETGSETGAMETGRETSGMETTVSSDTNGCCLASSQVDITFVVQDEKLPASKSVLIQRSEIFAAMLEGHYLEATQSTVNIAETSVYAFQYILHYLHGCNSQQCHMMKSLYRDTVSKEMAKNCIEILVESDKFFLPELHSEVKQCLHDRFIIPDSAFSVFKYSILRGWDDYMKSAVSCVFLDCGSEKELIEKLQEFLHSEYAEAFMHVLANVLIE